MYSKGRQLNFYPYDILVSIVARNFFSIPREKRSKIKVLDLGCGAGNNSKFLAESGFKVFGLDGSDSAVRACKERFSKWHLKGDFLQGDFLNLPYPDNFFDIIIDRESIYANCLPDIVVALNEVFRSLKPGGLFISFAYSQYHPDKKYGKKIGKNTYNNFKEGSFYRAGLAHFFNLGEINELFKKFRLENIMRHSLKNIKGKFMEYDEFIILARKSL